MAALEPQPRPLLPEPDDDSAPFWDGCSVGELRVQTCTGCGHRRFPPRPMCPACRSLDSRWEALSGRGTVWSHVVVHPPVLAAYAASAPYPVVVVALEEDPTLRMVGNLVTAPDDPINSIDPADIAIGQSVRVGFTEVVGSPGPDGHPRTMILPRWMPR